MNKRNKGLVSLIAAASLLGGSGAFAGGHWHGGGHHWHGGGGHWHHWHRGWHRWHPFWGPRVAFGVATAAVTTAAIASAASHPRVVYRNRVVYRDTPSTVRTCHINHGYRYCKTVTYN